MTRCVCFAGAFVVAASMMLAACEKQHDTSAQLAEAIFTNCSACHGPAGEGGQAPAFKGDVALAQIDYVLTHILTGSIKMPPFSEQLSDEEIATIAGYIRNSWGNDFGPVTVKDVQVRRAALAQSAAVTK